MIGMQELSLDEGAGNLVSYLVPTLVHILIKYYVGGK